MNNKALTVLTAVIVLWTMFMFILGVKIEKYGRIQYSNGWADCQQFILED